MHSAATSALTVLVVLAGMAGCLGADAAGEDPASSTATGTTVQPTDDDPPKGTTLLSVSMLEESEEREFSDRAVAFGNLTTGQREEFRQAVDCDCSVETAAFRFGTDQRVSVVAFQGDYYLVYVSKV